MVRLEEMTRRLRNVFASAGRSAPVAMERLESRVVLAGSPLPMLSELVNPNNTVVLFEFNVGDMYVELFDVGGPNNSPPAINTVNHFLRQIREGMHDESFVHRYEPDAFLPVNFVIQGGGFKFSNEDGLSEIIDDTVDNEFHPDRSNLQWTIAMAQRGGDPDSATTQWFVNMVDNDFLDAQLFTVFGRLIGETGVNEDNFNTARRIANRNLPNPQPPDQRFVFADVLVDSNQRPVTPLQPLAGANPLSFALTDVPVVEVPPAIPPGQLRSTAMMERYLYRLVNIDVVKPRNFEEFYTNLVVSPEGYRGPTIIETLDLVNLHADETASYEIIVRYERAGRDTVILTGTLANNEHRRITISDFNDPTLDLVRGHTPYALEIRSTQIVGAQITRTDFGARTSESLINTELLDAADLMTWEFGGTAVADLSPTDPNVARTPFLVWASRSHVDATITTTFYLAAGGTVEVTSSLEAYRRGGLEVFSIAGVGNNPLTGIRVESTQPIAVMLSVYEQQVVPGSPPGLNQFAGSTQGIAGGGLTAGALAAARFEDTGEAYIAVQNVANTGAVVSFQFRRTNGQTLLGNLIVPPESRRVFNLRQAGVPSGETFTITYTSGSTPVTAQYVSTLGGDRVVTPFVTQASGLWVFAGGNLNPTNNSQNEVLSVYNPFSSQTMSAQLNIFFHFAGATNNRIDLVPTDFELGPNERIDISVRDLVSIMAKINSDPATFSDYSISILAVGIDDLVPPFVAPVVAQLHNVIGTGSMSWSTIGTAASEIVRLTDPRFLPGTGS